ncbi:MAG TPA: hypothetical protein VJB94_01410 [Candidatus Nanoarchaeia archaeon]|nr:hypothetical protein [Candidatus Nanoarchaeia archaeon]
MQKGYTEQWIDRHFYGIFSDVILLDNYSKHHSNHTSKFDICRIYGADTIIEDSLETAEDCSSKGMKTLLLDYPWNQNSRDARIIRVKNWDEILKQI